jgi:hypothetical protein
VDRSALEREYSSKMEALGLRYANSIIGEAQNPLLSGSSSHGTVPGGIAGGGASGASPEGHHHHHHQHPHHQKHGHGHGQGYAESSHHPHLSSSGTSSGGGSVGGSGSGSGAVATSTRNSSLRNSLHSLGRMSMSMAGALSPGSLVDETVGPSNDLDVTAAKGRGVGGPGGAGGAGGGAVGSGSGGRASLGGGGGGEGGVTAIGADSVDAVVLDDTTNVHAESHFLNRDASSVLFNSLASISIAAADQMKQVRL